MSWEKLPLGPFLNAKLKKKSLEHIQSHEDKSFWGQNLPNCPEREFFQKKKTFTKFSCTSLTFSLCKIFKKSLVQIKRYDSVCRFWTQIGAFVQEKIFFIKNISIISIYLLAPFIEQNLKKIIRDPKMVHLSQRRIFSEKPYK